MEEPISEATEAAALVRVWSAALQIATEMFSVQKRETTEARDSETTETTETTEARDSETTETTETTDARGDVLSLQSEGRDKAEKMANLLPRMLSDTK